MTGKSGSQTSLGFPSIFPVLQFSTDCTDFIGPFVIYFKNLLLAHISWNDVDLSSELIKSPVFS